MLHNEWIMDLTFGYAPPPPSFLTEEFRGNLYCIVSPYHLSYISTCFSPFKNCFKRCGKNLMLIHLDNTTKYKLKYINTQINGT